MLATLIRRTFVTNMQHTSSSPSKFKKLDQLKLEYTFLAQLPVDPLSLRYVNPNTSNKNSTMEEKLQFLRDVRKEEPNRPSESSKSGCFSLVQPEKMPFPKLLHYAPKALELLELEEGAVKEASFIKYLAGNDTLPRTHPWAHCYAGHQFGYFAGRLGDGRAMSLAEIVNSRGERWELQLKGSGETPYSRMGDGFAVVRSSIREYLCSEGTQIALTAIGFNHRLLANEALGIPTTRALSLIKTAQLVHREQLEPGAIVGRLAPSWLRFGSFEWFRMTKDPEGLKYLADYALRTHFPDIETNCKDAPYVGLFSEIAIRTGKLFALWQSNGFCHGVLNTDNISILGLTLDYGPFGFMDKFDPSWTPNLSDGESRYSYEQQPGIGAWNVAKLGLALQPLISPDSEIFDLKPGMGDVPEDYPLEVLEGVKSYWTAFRSTYTNQMRQKLGLATWLDNDPELLLSPLMNLLETDEVDYTRFFRYLSLKADSLQSDPIPVIGEIIQQLQPGPTSLSYKNDRIDVDGWSEWLKLYSSRLNSNTSPPSTSMLKANPRFVLRNWIAQAAIDAFEAPTPDDDTFQAIFDLLTVYPFAEDADIDWECKDYLTPELASLYAGPVPPSSRSVRCSCSS